MPAVELSRLRRQIDGLIARFDNPEELRTGLRDILEMYANRAYRPGQAVQAQPLLPGYRVAPLIIQQLELELGKICQERPEQALAVVEALWRDAFLEPRLLATVLLGAIPPSHADAVVARVRDWATPSENFRIIDALFINGTIMVRRSAPGLLLGLFADWLGSSRSDVQSLAVRGLIPLIQDPVFSNLPAVFRLLSPFIQSVPGALQTDLQIAIESLAKRSPTETAFFLRQTLSMAAGPATARLIRRCMACFGPAQQASLRAALQAASTS